MPPRPAQTQSVRAHPAYPLSQVSRGVLSSTSNTANTTGVAAAAVTSANLGSIVPERETTNVEKLVAADVTGPTVSSTEAPAFNTAAEAKATEPTTETALGDLEDLGSALHDAIAADLDSDLNVEINDSENAETTAFDTEFFESELLSSLDISAADDAVDDKSKDDIEGEMEKLLGELTKDEIRHN